MEIWAHLLAEGGVASGLRLLLKSFDYSRDAEIDPWQFAVEWEELESRGITTTDVRWLLAKGYAKHAKEITLPMEDHRGFLPLSPTCLTADMCFILTPAGGHAIQNVLFAEKAGDYQAKCVPEPDRASPVRGALPPNVRCQFGTQRAES